MGDWFPGAVRRPQTGGVTLDRSLPARGVWHITWDQLRPGGAQPAMEAVGGYLERVGYCPNLLWNPFTGDVIQYYPASVGGRALKYNNQDGAVCLQVEVFFTPGCVVDGRKYMTVAETPLKGWAELIAWMESLGIPRRWPLGMPQWSGNSRDVATWNGQAGHYGHCHSPGDDHTDPGPMPAFPAPVVPQSTTTTTKDEKMLYITQSKGDPVIWIGDMISRRPIGDVAELETLRKYAKAGVLNIYKDGDTQTWPASYIGVPVTPIK